ncbi:hypothetical protein Slala05_82600 [Streptomyces lavendulae subsp. lavendulae]|nr:hypothetical protein Slala05_82600 [Streptomyces lavendulae subsp. lavendulae]
MALTAFCLFLPEMNFSRSFAAGGGPANPNLCAVDDPGLSAGAEVVDDLGKGAEPDAGGDGAAAGCEQRPYLADSAGDRGPVDTKPAGQHVVSGTVAKVDERGREPVDKDQLVLCAGAHGPLAWPGLQSRLLPFMP